MRGLVLITGAILVPALGAERAAADTPSGTAEERQKLQGALTELEKKTWAALQGRDAEVVRDLWADDFVGVLASGLRRTKPEVLRTLPDLAVTTYALAEVRLVPLTAESAVLTYRLARQSTFKGRELPADCYASSVWVKRGGRWRITFYQETPVPSRP